MKKRYESPVIFVVAIDNDSDLLIVNNVKGNTNLKLGSGSSEEARSRESHFWTNDNNEYEE